mgnify:CR=1 FL=1
MLEHRQRWRENHMHSIACREADETSMLIEWYVNATIEG